MNVGVDVDRRDRAGRLTGPAVTAAVIVVVSVALHLRDPHSNSWGVCPWQTITGTDCPGCGGLRAVNDLTNLRVAAAASSNLLFVAGLPFFALWFAAWVRNAWAGERAPLAHRPTLVAWVTAAVVAVWWIVRNLPGLEWLRA